MHFSAGASTPAHPRHATSPACGSPTTPAATLSYVVRPPRIWPAADEHQPGTWASPAAAGCRWWSHDTSTQTAPWGTTLGVVGRLAPGQLPSAPAATDWMTPPVTRLLQQSITSYVSLIKQLTGRNCTMKKHEIYNKYSTVNNCGETQIKSNERTCSLEAASCVFYYVNITTGTTAKDNIAFKYRLHHSQTDKDLLSKDFFQCRILPHV